MVAAWIDYLFMHLHASVAIFQYLYFDYLWSNLTETLTTYCLRIPDDSVKKKLNNAELQQTAVSLSDYLWADLAETSWLVDYKW